MALPLATLQFFCRTLPRLQTLKLGTGSPLLIDCSGFPDSDSDSPGAGEKPQSGKLHLRQVVLGDVFPEHSQSILDVLDAFEIIDELHFKPSPTMESDPRNGLPRNLDIVSIGAEKLKVHRLVFLFWWYTQLPCIFLDVIRTVLDPASLRQIESIVISDFVELSNLDEFIRDVGAGLEELQMRLHSRNVDCGFGVPFGGM